uniref:Uncharacterized protein n=1 Tax=Ixodes ricinus TaxID=34613 RepID=A0A6B0ULR8_IXORI
MQEHNRLNDNLRNKIALLRDNVCNVKTVAPPACPFAKHWTHLIASPSLGRFLIGFDINLVVAHPAIFSEKETVPYIYPRQKKRPLGRSVTLLKRKARDATCVRPVNFIFSTPSAVC